MLALLDTHQHLIYPQMAGYAWTDNIPVLAHKAFTLPDYAALTKGRGMAATIFMEAGVDDADYQKEARFVASLAADPANKIVGMIASCRPENDEGFDDWLAECTELPVVGFRRILHEIDDDLSKSEAFRANVRKIGRRGLTFDMCFRADQLPIAIQLARACDDMPLVLDHCGVPDIAGGNTDDWYTHISALARLPHVNCKISGVLAYCAPGNATLGAVRPYLEHVVEAFGTNRLVWGSDWPVVNMGADIVEWMNVTRDFLAPLAQNEQTKIAIGNARRIYNISEPIT